MSGEVCDGAKLFIKNSFMDDVVKDCVRAFYNDALRRKEFQLIDLIS